MELTGGLGRSSLFVSCGYKRRYGRLRVRPSSGRLTEESTVKGPFRQIEE